MWYFVVILLCYIKSRAQFYVWMSSFLNHLVTYAISNAEGIQAEGEVAKAMTAMQGSLGWDAGEGDRVCFGLCPGEADTQ